MWQIVQAQSGKWQLPDEGVDVILRIGDGFYIGYLVKDDEDWYFNIEGPLEEMAYALDDVHSWCDFIKPCNCEQSA